MNPPHPLSPLAEMTLGEVAEIVHGEPAHGGHADRRFGPICTDSRQLNAGEFFLALRGEQFDGHRFCRAAVQKGAAGIIVDAAHEADEDLAAVPIIRVEDTLRAYGDLAADRRRRWGGQVLAISGSAGKTTTRRLAAAALSRHVKTLEPIMNYNNLIGVPHTLMRLEAAHEAAVLELGMNLPGELERLTAIAAPSVALLTQIGLAHVGMFNSLDALVEAKFDLFRGCAPGTPLVINAACPRTTMRISDIGDEYPVTGFLGDGEPRWEPAGLARAENVTLLEPFGYRFDLIWPEGRLGGLSIRYFGRHHLENVAAAAALLLAAGHDPGWLAEALEDFKTEPYRGEIVQAGPMRFILDCYNAAPQSMLGALRSLDELPASGRRVVVFGDMGELGQQTVVAHDMLLGPLRELGDSVFFGLGKHFSRLAETLASEGRRAQGFLEHGELIQALRAELEAGDVVLFKGSHALGLEHVAHALAPEAGILAEADQSSP